MNELINGTNQLNTINSRSNKDSIMLNILRRSEISPDILLKHSEERNAIWRILLTKLKDEYENFLERNMKYPTFNHFKVAYRGKLLQENTIDEREMKNLWKIANWTFLLLNLMLGAKKVEEEKPKKPRKQDSQQRRTKVKITKEISQQPMITEFSKVARANKGLVLHVVPRVVEGPNGKTLNVFSSIENS
jgi:hypothetical protein